MLSHFSSVIVNSNLPLSNRRGANVSFGGQELVYQEYEILYVDLDFDGHELIQLSDVGDNVVMYIVSTNPYDMYFHPGEQHKLHKLNGLDDLCYEEYHHYVG